MKKKAKKHGLGAVALSRKKQNMYDKYNALQSKNNLKNTLIKSLAEVIGATLGAGLSATAGSKVGIPTGVILIGLGNYFDEKSGLLKIAGASAVAYGIAKAIEEQNASVNGLGEIDKAKNRLGKFKDELLVAFYIDKLLPKKGSTSSSSTNSDIAGFEDEQMGRIDLSSLDMFERFNEEQAQSFSNPVSGDFPIDFAYSIIDDYPDE